MADVAQRIIELIGERTEVDATTITTDTSLEDIDIQSLDLVELIMEVEDIYDIEINMNAVEAWDKMTHVRDLVDAVNGLVAQKA